MQFLVKSAVDGTQAERICERDLPVIASAQQHTALTRTETQCSSATLFVDPLPCSRNTYQNSLAGTGETVLQYFGVA